LILIKISKFGASRCQILRLKCTKFDFRWGRLRPRWGSLQRYARPPSSIKRGLLPRGGRGKREEGKRERKGRGEKPGEREGERPGPPNTLA